MNLSKLSLFAQKRVPRWVILFIDLLICVFSFFSAYLLRFNFSISPKELEEMFRLLPLVLAARALAFFWTKTYTGVVRYTGSQDAIRIFIALAASSSVVSFINFIGLVLENQVLIPSSIIILDFILALLGMVAARLGYKLFFQQIKPGSTNKINVVIFGAGQSGMITKKTLESDNRNSYNIIGYLDDDLKKAKTRIDGITVFNTEKDFDRILSTNKIDELIISIQNISKNRKKEIIEKGLSHNVKVKNIPPVEKWINGELSFGQIKNVKIEDLLERDEIQLDKQKMSEMIAGKTVLITGSAGSIGSEIVRQIIPFFPERLILFNQGETPLYELEKELIEKFKNHPILNKIEYIVGDIKSYSKVSRTFKKYKPQLIYHAAAYKHVPLMEGNPAAAVLTNVMGTKILADLAVEHQVSKFVMVSTDKAVNPTNVMGASKRVAEIYVQSLNFSEKNKGTQFITTRFGNVLGSNGSVIPLFRKQIEKGGPITVTHPEITRFFMTIPEACQLVLEAGNMGKGGEIFLFDMGQSVKIVDLAKKMIKLSGLTLGKDIQIEFSGLRPGEKIYEELLQDTENTVATHHPKITIAKIKPFDYSLINEEIDELLELVSEDSNESIVKKMKQIVPEFISNNSIYTALDVIKISQ